MDDKATVTEHDTKDKTTGDSFVSLTLKNGARRLNLNALEPNPELLHSDLNSTVKKSEVVSELHFVPYYFRANRGGKGHMRVGLKKMGA